ncbi:tripartite tricarboxylate transporter substrate binding protein [Hydrogenophaga sp.]|uniref:Bug family tripartite tricarboxylate transporter substrate binding protein n=1 Tax=Hydrogenophaga sp. TaxID=1904254 RepID=UPI0027263386|nr:tripartite tricarboxylate transporter substrate binding protein [Hydrogenophaga sp.]MDO9435829.1 tripartite tricarboxylate transporter substrate binding protein [Hydrogenophaga sp.]
MRTQHPLRHRLLRQTVLCLAALLPFASSAQGAYPSKPISILVGLQAGTGSDVGVRVLAERLSAALKQPIAVDNLPGAGGQLAATKGIKATPDGYYLVALSSATVTALPILDPHVGFDPFKDLVPVAMVATIPSVFFVRPDLPARSLKDFLADAKAQPGRMTYASGGNGSAQHIGMEIFKAMNNIALVHIPYKGSGQATVDVAGGRVDSGIQGISTVLPYLKTGKLRALAATGEARSTQLPELPTVKELGLGDFVYEPWTALFAPVGTPPDVVNALNAAVRKIASDPEFKARFEVLGLGAQDDTPQRLAARMKADFTSTAAVVRERNIKAE